MIPNSAARAIHARASTSAGSSCGSVYSITTTPSIRCRTTAPPGTSKPIFCDSVGVPSSAMSMTLTVPPISALTKSR